LKKWPTFCFLKGKIPELQNASAKNFEKITRTSDTSTPLDLIFSIFSVHNVTSYNGKCEDGVLWPNNVIWPCKKNSVTPK
jgi:hypothetical protein